jgi:hypothetical protein
LRAALRRQASETELAMLLGHAVAQKPQEHGSPWGRANLCQSSHQPASRTHNQRKPSEKRWRRTPWLSNRSRQRASWLSAARTRAASTALGRNKSFTNRQPYWSNSPIAAPTAAPEFRKPNRALIAAQNVLETGARSSSHKPLQFNQDRVFQQHRDSRPEAILRSHAILFSREKCRQVWDGLKAVCSATVGAP